MMKNSKNLSKIAIVLSLISVIMAGVVNVTQQTIWIAGTQWILVGVLLAIYAVYLNSCECGTGGGQQ